VRELSQGKRKRASVMTLIWVCLACAGCGASGGGPSVASAGTGSVSVSWSAPTQNTDGTALTDLSGYRVLYGTNPSALTQSVEVVGSSNTGKVISGLASGTHFFAVAAVNSSGEASDPSNAAAMTIQ
jgi:hypothetical protein